MSVHFAKVIPELLCSDLDESLRFYCGVLGFSMLFERPSERFAFLALDGRN